MVLSAKNMKKKYVLLGMLSAIKHAIYLRKFKLLIGYMGIGIALSAFGGSPSVSTVQNNINFLTQKETSNRAYFQCVSLKTLKASTLISVHLNSGISLKVCGSRYDELAKLDSTLKKYHGKIKEYIPLDRISTEYGSKFFINSEARSPLETLYRGLNGFSDGTEARTYDVKELQISSHKKTLAEIYYSLNILSRDRIRATPGGYQKKLSPQLLMILEKLNKSKELIIGGVNSNESKPKPQGRKMFKALVIESRRTLLLRTAILLRANNINEKTYGIASAEYNESLKALKGNLAILSLVEELEWLQVEKVCEGTACVYLALI